MKAITVLLLGLLVLGFAACRNGGDDGSGDGDNGGGEAMSFAEGCQKSEEKQFSAPPPRIIDTSKTYVATITTSRGAIVAELKSDLAVTTNNFVYLACKGFYDGLTFHRVENWVIQGGDPQGTGGGGPGYQIPGEFEGAVFDVGAVGMARTQDPDSAGSQFFITLEPARHLDGQYAAFGQVTQGMDVAAQTQIGDVITSVTIEER